LKVSSNVEIARSLRNNFRVSVAKCVLGVERLNSIGGLPGYPSKPNSEYQCIAAAARRRGISFVVERGTTQIAR
jgi:hypothetical protein